MNSIFKIELKKAFSNKLFLSAVIIATVIAVLCAVYNIQVMQIEKEYYQKTQQISGGGVNPDLPAYGLYNHWICQDFSSYLSSLFFMLFPLFATVAYGWSFYTERKSGYIYSVITRTDKGRYYAAKYLAVFLSGGTVITIPVVINFLLVACYLPAVRPDMFYDMYYGVSAPGMFAELFYTYPLIYCILRMFVTFVFGGSVALISFALTFIVPNRVAVSVLPFLICLGLHYMGTDLVSPQFPAEISPISILGSHGHHYRLLWIAVLEAAIPITISLIICLYKGRHEDVY